MKRSIGLLLLLASVARPDASWGFQRETTDDPDCTEDAGVNCPHRGTALTWHSQPVTFVVNPSASGIDPSAAVAAVRAAFDTWQGASDGGITFSFGGTTNAGANGQDGQNTVTWTNLGSATSDAFAQSVLTYSTKTGAISDVDIQLNAANVFAVLPDGTDNPFDFRVDIQAVVTHESGHLLGLAHENRFGPQVVMFFSDTSGNTTHRHLTSDDRAGVRAIYANGSAGGGGGGGGCAVAPGDSRESLVPVALLLAVLGLRRRPRGRTA